MTQHLLVVCTGNICRSPVAEVLLQQALPGCTVESAGTMAEVGNPAHRLSAAVGEAQGLDLKPHRARQLTEAMLKNADLVLALDASHRDWIHRRYPAYRDKVHLLGRWQQDADVPDPWGHPRAVFERVHAQMASQVNDWAGHLK